MQDTNKIEEVKHPPPEEMFVIDPVSGKPRYSFSLKEIAELMGYQRDWAYSNYKQGKLKGISNLGQVVVPASELYRLQAEATHLADALREGKVYYV